MLYRDPQHGSPVRGDPGDLLLIPGFNFSPSSYVIYQAIADTTQRLSPPSPLPSGQTAASGKIVPVAVGTNAVKVQLPTVMTAGQSYAIWVVNPSGVSFDIEINDARPMWLSPGPLASARRPSYPYVYRSTDRPDLNREIKIVGRNLQPAPGAQTKVRLARYLLDCGAADSIPGPVFVLTAAADGNPATQVERYAATVKLPVDLPEGNYSVTISRDGVSWVPLDPVMRLTILPDPVHSAPIDISTFAGGAAGPCRGDDQIDDTLCITRAIHKAGEQGGGDVVFPSGTWLLDRDCWTDGDDFPPPCEQLWGGWGIIVPAKVNLIGAAGPGAASRPTIETREKFDQPFLKRFPPTVDSHIRVHQFTLMGSNLIQGLWFHDSYRPNYPDTGTSSPGANALYVLGDDITITDNVFEATYSAVEAWWHRLPESSLGKGLHGEDLIGNRNVVVTGNTFAVHGHSGAVGFAVLEHSVISRNSFLAGAYPHTVALGTHGGRHVDISANTVNGIDQTHSGNLIGWRAGIFLNHTASQENILVAGSLHRPG